MHEFPAKARRRGPCGLLAALLLIAACGDEPPAQTAAPSPSALQSSSPAQGSGLRPGEIRAAVREGRVFLQAREARVDAILRRLADAAGARLEMGELPRIVTVSLEGETWDRALSDLVYGLAYEYGYDPDPRTGLHRLVSIRVGPLEGEPAPEAAEDPVPGDELAAAPPAGIRDAILDSPLLAEDAPESDEAREARDARAAELARLDDPDPDRRVRAVSFLRPTGDGLERLRDLAANDPQGRVRAAAVAQLGDGDSYRALEGLVEALADPDLAVVLEAIDELAFQDDPTLASHLEPLLAHDDPRVAEAAGEAIEFLQF